MERLVQFGKVSKHVRPLVGRPNIEIVMGNDAMLVVDTGLGPENSKLRDNKAKR